MPTPSRRPLKPNPFVSLRDPQTGKWRVVINFASQVFAYRAFQENPPLKRSDAQKV